MSGIAPLSYTLAFHSTEGDEAGLLDEAWELLSTPERARAERFHFERDRDRWVRGRAWIRQQLGTELGLPASDLEIAVEPSGRLYVPGAPFDFNLSHTGGWIMLGICQDGRIGVDIETINPTFPALEIAAEFFLPAEQDWIAQGPSVERFFHLWTAKEAMMKVTGRGMSLAPDSINVAMQNDHPATVTNLENGAVFPVKTRQGPGNTIAAFVLT